MHLGFGNCFFSLSCTVFWSWECGRGWVSRVNSTTKSWRCEPFPKISLNTQPIRRAHTSWTWIVLRKLKQSKIFGVCMTNVGIGGSNSQIPGIGWKSFIGFPAGTLVKNIAKWPCFGGTTAFVSYVCVYAVSSYVTGIWAPKCRGTKGSLLMCHCCTATLAESTFCHLAMSIWEALYFSLSVSCAISGVKFKCWIRRDWE